MARAMQAVSHPSAGLGTERKSNENVGEKEQRENYLKN